MQFEESQLEYDAPARRRAPLHNGTMEARADMDFNNFGPGPSDDTTELGSWPADDALELGVVQDSGAMEIGESEMAPEPNATVLKEGWLLKCGDSGFLWNRRYFRSQFPSAFRT